MPETGPTYTPESAPSISDNEAIVAARNRSFAEDILKRRAEIYARTGEIDTRVVELENERRQYQKYTKEDGGTSSTSDQIIDPKPNMSEQVQQQTPTDLATALGDSLEANRGAVMHADEELEKLKQSQTPQS